MPDDIKYEHSEHEANVELLRFEDGRELYIIGTAHVSKASVELVERKIEELQPDCVCIELDEGRYNSIMNKSSYENLDLIKLIMEGKLFFFIGQFILSSFQKRMSEKTESSAGAEFKRAAEIAKEKGLKIVLADRDIGVTLKRAWRLTSFFKKIQLLAALFFSDDEDMEDVDIEELKKSDALNELVKQFSDSLPVTKRVLIDERDTYLSAEIQHNMGKRSVAVVGAGHVPGMLEKLKHSISREEKEGLNFVPKDGIVGKILPWILPAAIIGLFIYGFINGDWDKLKEAAITWVVINGALSAVGSIAALAHPLTIISAFIAAPITSLNPTIGAGFVTGIVQTFLVRPRVKDFEEIQQKSLKISEWWKNRITRVFLVFLFSSFGSAVGTWVAGANVIGKLFN